MSIERFVEKLKMFAQENEKKCRNLICQKEK
jgi:hypothetical protein